MKKIFISHGDIILDKIYAVIASFELILANILCSGLVFKFILATFQFFIN